MEINKKLQEIDIINRINFLCFFFDDIININGVAFDNILLDEVF